jgi:hypothetical protein
MARQNISRASRRFNETIRKALREGSSTKEMQVYIDKSSSTWVRRSDAGSKQIHNGG